MRYQLKRMDEVTEIAPFCDRGVLGTGYSFDAGNGAGGGGLGFRHSHSWLPITASLFVVTIKAAVG